MLDSVQIVMVNTTHSGNIGAAARAMKNMGLSRLVLVDPIAALDDEAKHRSSGASDILDNARIVATLEEAIADCGVVIGASARNRHLPWPLMSPRQCGAKVREVIPAGNQVAVVFGRESSGLSNEELHLCNAHVHIPTNPDFSSLNVASAVQVLCYEIRMALVEEDVDTAVGPWGVVWDHPLASQQQMQGLLEHSEKKLFELGFLSPKTANALMARLARIYQRAGLDQTEVSILRGILSASHPSARHTSQGE